LINVLAIVAGTHMSNARPRTVPWNRLGVTPTTISVSPLIFKCWPIAEGAPPNRDCQ
jgi:hypothetical protein